MLELLTTLHLLAAIFWIGGMMFVLTMLLPSLTKLSDPPPPQLMPTVLVRFLQAVMWAAIVLAGTGPWIKIGIAYPVFYVKLALAVIMILIYAYIRARYLKPLEVMALRPAGAEPDPAQPVVLAGVRRLATINLSLGLVIVVLVEMG